MTCSTSTSTFLRLLVLLGLASLCLAGPRYIAIPIDGVDVIELNPIPPPSYPLAGISGGGPSLRLPRQVAEGYLPLGVSALHHAAAPSAGSVLPEPMIEQTVQLRPERATAHILDYVDFGAHTGPNGAFSWYADYPSHH